MAKADAAHPSHPIHPSRPGHPAEAVEPIVVDAHRSPAAAAPATPPAEPTVDELAAELRRQREAFARLRQITERINRGVRLEEVLDFIWDEFRGLIPYNRIAFATIDPETGRVVSRWARSDGAQQFFVGYSRPLEETSLRELARTGRPRVMNDLAAYAAERPQSEVTRMLVDEGLRSSLTCPLVVEGRPVGFLFFDSQQVAVYSDVHVEFFMQLAGVISVGVERGRIVSELDEQKEIIERQNRLLAEENRRNQQELEMARRVQQSLIPESLPECAGLDLALHYQPAIQIGGDLVDVVPLAGGPALVYMADAMGHGVPAALLISVVHTAFHAAAAGAGKGDAPSPARLLEEVNRTVIELFDTNYVTAICGVADVAAGRLTYALAGHPPPLLWRAGEDEVVQLAEGGVPLGIDGDTAYRDAAVPLAPGDLLLLYTDGLIEAEGPSDDRFGLDRLTEFLYEAGSASAGDVVRRLRKALERFTGGRALADDVALLALKSLGLD